MQPNPDAELAQGRGQIVEAGAPRRSPPGVFGILEIRPVRARVLGDDQDLLHAGAGQFLRLSQHLADGTAGEPAAHRGDDAEAAVMIAALGDLEVGIVARREFHALLRNEIGERLVLRRQMFMHRGDHFLIALGAGDLQYLRVPIEDFLGLRAEAAGHDDLAVLGERLADGFQRFIHRRIDETAGIHDDQIRGAVARGHFVALGSQSRENALGIDQRLGASQADESDFGRSAANGYLAGGGFQGIRHGVRGKGRHSTPNRPFDGQIALSNGRFENRDVLLRKAPEGAAIALKYGRPRPINPLNVVTGPPAWRVK